MEKITDNLKRLYNYGELKQEKIDVQYLDWLLEQGWLIQQQNYLLISDRWIELSSLIKDEEEFIKHLFTFHPQYQKYLLVEVLRVGLDIANAEDEKGLMDFINSLPNLAADILQLYQSLASSFDKEPEELAKSDWETMKEEYQTELTAKLDELIFKGVIDYPKLMRILVTVQKIELQSEKEINDLPVVDKIDLDNNWTSGRRVTSNPYLNPVDNLQYTLVPTTNHFSYSELTINDYLNNPWGVFLIIFGMVERQLQAGGNDRISLRPTAESDNGYQPAGIDFFTFLDNGREVYVSSFEELIEDFLDFKGIKLFPAKQFNLTQYFTQLLEDEVYTYHNEEYILEDEIDALLYRKPLLILKNKCNQLKSELKNYLERLAKSYED
ncbi:hypothetical protein MWH25_11010 [Natroniella acetigena]|uniref:hypothetical protein n=1 Tax=Natroniella acetigena TaxID=52004 RepID=UPI002009F33C|nr:hypothetical protein [Natroniella acetigena]MCK8828262.1 hypothetical protein [Natroniella acetigena]